MPVKKNNKRLILIALALGLLVCFYFILNKEVSINQGVNGKVSSIKMPLYVKLMDYWSRSNHYKLLAKRITKDSETNTDKLVALHNWTASNIRPKPKGFPALDDHVDNIIIRGYGSDDQSADVFTTLAAAAGFKGGIYLVKIYPEKNVHAISIIEIDGRKLLFDTYFNFYFYNENGKIASLNEIRKNINLVKKVAKEFKLSNRFEYSRFYENLKPVEKIGWTKADLQFPFNRFIYTLGRLLRISEPSGGFFGESYQ